MNSDALEDISAHLERDNELRIKIKEEVAIFDKKTRQIVGVLNKVHSTPADQVPTLVESAKPLLEDCKQITATLVIAIPPNQFWRWNQMWSNSLRTAVFAAALLQFLSDGTLISLPDVERTLGIQEEWQDRLNVPTEDYLHGLISLVNELSRLAVNSVTLGNFDEPIKISVFVKEIFAGFSLLNLKNDLLRRRFDSLKYDVKKIEEVVYDVALRKLAKPPTKAV